MPDEFSPDERHPRPVPTGIDYARVERRRRMMRFFETFGDLLDDAMPISQIAALFDETHQALKEKLLAAA